MSTSIPASFQTPLHPVRWSLSLALLITVIAGAGCTSTVTPDVVVEPTFTSIQQNVFSQTCSSSSCHSTGSQRGGLVLEAGKSYANLINVVPTNVTAKNEKLRLVVPGKPDSSFLMIKLTGPRSGLEGSLMPFSGDPLNAQTIEAIRTWIANGAKQD